MFKKIKQSRYLNFLLKISDSTKYIEWLNELLSSMEPLARVKQETHNYTLHVKEMIDYVENIWETMLTYDSFYSEVNTTYDVFLLQKNDVDNLNSNILQSLDRGQTLVEEGLKCVMEAENNLQV